MGSGGRHHGGDRAIGEPLLGPLAVIPLGAAAYLIGVLLFRLFGSKDFELARSAFGR